MKYDVNYFIEKFSHTLAEMFFTGDYLNYEGTKFCAMGLCGRRDYCPTEESDALCFLFDKSNLFVAFVNDGVCELYTQPTPKQRILAALYDIRDKELSEANIKEASKIVNEVLV